MSVRFLPYVQHAALHNNDILLSDFSFVAVNSRFHFTVIHTNPNIGHYIGCNSFWILKVCNKEVKFRVEPSRSDQWCNIMQQYSTPTKLKSSIYSMSDNNCGFQFWVSSILKS